MSLEESPDRRRLQPVTVARGERELRLEAPLAPELSPACACRVPLRRRADVIVARPAVALALRAMDGAQHRAQGGEVAARAEVEPLHQQIGLAAGQAVRDGLGCAGTGGTQRPQSIGLGGEGVRKVAIIELQEYRASIAQRAIALVDATAAHGLLAAQAERGAHGVLHHPDVRRVLARLRRSTRMPMKARSNLLRQAMLACSRSATRMRRMRDGPAAVTVAPRSGLAAER